MSVLGLALEALYGDASCAGCPLSRAALLSGLLDGL